MKGNKNYKLRPENFSTRLPREIQKQLRLWALMNDLSVQEATTQIVSGFLKRHPVEIKKIEH